MPINVRCGQSGEAAAAVVVAAAAAGPGGGDAAAVQAGEADGGDGPPPVPQHLHLRPFRSHVCVVSAQVEFCMRCMSKAPRFRTAVWRTDCCDGDSPIGGVPKHILAEIAADRPQWPVRQFARGLLLVQAANAHGRAVAAMAPHRPKRRQVGGRQDSPEGLGCRGRVDRGREAACGRTAPPRAALRSGVLFAPSVRFNLSV